MKKNIYNIIFFCCFLLFGWSNSCFGGNATPSEIFSGYIQEEYAPESFPEYKEFFDSSFVRSEEEINHPDKKLAEFLEGMKNQMKGNNFSSLKMLSEIQESVNSLGHRKDKFDYWQSIGQTVESGGDCDDSAVAKAVLASIFFPESEVFLVQGRKDRGYFTGEDHLVVVVRIKNEVFVLDDDSGKELDDVVGVEVFSAYYVPYMIMDVRRGIFSLLYPYKDKFFPGQQVARVE